MKIVESESEKLESLEDFLENLYRCPHFSLARKTSQNVPCVRNNFTWSADLRHSK